MLQFDKPLGTIDEADFHWQTWVDGGADVFAKYWDSSWKTLGKNNGGSAPPEIVNDVSNKFGTNYLYILLFGNVETIPEDWIKCDIGKVNYTLNGLGG